MRTRHLVVGTLAMTLVAASALTWSDAEHAGWGRPAYDVRPPADATYVAECGSCHYAYPPGLLPSRSWERVLAGLSDHFGDNAELPAETLQHLSRFLADNAAEHGDGWIARRIADSLPGDETALRISQLGYIRRQHDEIPERLIRGNDKVRSRSNCAACHSGADQGIFDEHRVEIPGHGRWDD